MDINLLKHNNIKIEVDLITKLIWYSAAKDSYIQRNSLLDDTWINDEASNPYVAFLCRKFLKLKQFIIYDNECFCNNFVRSISCLPNDTFGIYLSNKSL